jgi:hypothetical protein
MHARSAVVLGALVLSAASAEAKPCAGVSHDDPAFCINAPAGFKPQAPNVNPAGGLIFRGTKISFSVYWYPLGPIPWEKRLAAFEEGVKNTLVDKGELSGGRGAYFVTKVGTQQSLNVLMQGKAKDGKPIYFKCAANGKPELTEWPAITEACKSLTQ